MNLVHRIGPFLSSRGNVVGSLLALGCLACLVLGVPGGVLWLPAAVVLYVIGVLIVPAQRGLKLEPAKVQDADEVSAGLERLLVNIHGRVADDIYVRVDSIHHSIASTLPSNGTADTTDPSVFLVRQTALNYLPQALDAYLAVPRSYAEGRTVAGGQTPHDALLQQLDLMDARLHDVSEAMIQHDSDRLLANTRFLAERFAGSSLRLTAPVAATPAEQATQPESVERTHVP